ncbi:hypothetical protein [Pseudoclavibacter sp. VKM Ac-2867]|uniref:hypothetical protein n=1 Tax=Pseudoclavibacter sp. VKM Ac-2867 TaxID=2783829 RepID=UPI00188CD1C5|nr:hypothetical protein [Pseudoclavibacter sp. VKM Ac-2867]MBF4459287.1 hypothetical protein [Pseudoclavibacter sp. VKM Ac-2867]
MTALRPQQFPTIEAIRGRWALVAAIETAILGEGRDSSHADEHGWFYSDGGGSWARLTPLPDGRAVLAGIDRDHSETHRRGLDLITGMPDWGVAHVEAAVSSESGRHWETGGEQPWLGFVYWRENAGEAWRTVDHGLADGLDKHLLPVLSEEQMLAAAADWFEGAVMDLDDPESAPEQVDAEAVRRGAELGPDLTAQALNAVLPFEGMHIEAAVRAARAFSAAPR